MTQVLLHLSEEIAERLKRAVPARQRSAFVQGLIEKALPPEDSDWLYKLALAVEADEDLNAEMADWDVAAADGLADD